MSSTRNQLAASAKPKNRAGTARVENNRRRVLCVTCRQPIPAYVGTRVDDATTGAITGYRHVDCPEPKYKRPRSPKRDLHALDAHVLRIKRRTFTDYPIRVCCVKGCRYSERFDSAAGDWLPLTDTTGARVPWSEQSSRAPEPGLVNLPLFAPEGR